MSEVSERLESGFPHDGHRPDDAGAQGPILGEGDFRYELSGTNWGNLPEGWVYKEATAVAVDTNDRIYVFNRGTSPMIVFDTDGNMVDHWGEGIFQNPHGVSVANDGNLWCVDNGDSTVRKMSPSGEVLMTLGEAGKPSPKMSGVPFSVPTHVAVDPTNGDFYVADGYSNASVHKFNEGGELISTWGESGTDPGQFNIVHNIATDSDGMVYVADRENHRVQKFSPDGEFQMQVVNMSRAAAIYIDTRGAEDLIYIGEYFSGIASNDVGTNLGPRVTVLKTNGDRVARVGTEPYGSQSGRFYSPHGIAVDSKGDIYVAEVSHSDYGRGWNLEHEHGELRSMQKLVKV
jgi:DNA-binding beta-propeller fold protein YncE